MDPQVLFNQGKIVECYESLLESKTDQLAQLRLIYECEKILKHHDFKKWNISLLIESFPFLELYKFYKDNYGFLTLSMKVLVWEKMWRLGNLYYVKQELLNELSQSLEIKDYGRFLRIVDCFDEYLWDDINYQVLLFNKSLVIQDETNLVKLLKVLQEKIKLVWRENRSDEQLKKNMKITLNLIESLDELENITLYSDLQILKLEFNNRLMLNVDRENFLRSSVFFIENDKLWKKYWKSNDSVVDKTLIMKLSEPAAHYSIEKYKKNKLTMSELENYKEGVEEEHLRKRIKYNDPDIVDNANDFVKAFFELGYYEATRQLCEQTGLENRLEYLYSLWYLKKFTKLIEVSNQPQYKNNLESMYLSAKSWYFLKEREKSKKILLEILKINPHFKDVKDLVFDV